MSVNDVLQIMHICINVTLMELRNSMSSIDKKRERKKGDDERKGGRRG